MTGDDLSDGLIAAAARGDATRIRDLIEAGADPNLRDEHGATAMHRAVAGHHVDAAACLLAYGADHTLVDGDGTTPLALDFCRLDVLHGIRQRHHRRTFNGTRAPDASPDAQQWASALERDGIVKVSGLVAPDVLESMREDFDEFAHVLDAKLARGQARFRHYDEEEHLWVGEHAYVCNNAFKYSKALTAFCCNPKLVETAELYVGLRPFIQRGLAMRYLPCNVPEKDMFGWHHDMEERRCKAMILLTDVGEGDQCMSYVRGSHKLYHPYLMFVRNPCSLEYCREHLPEIDIYNAYGKAGDVFLFDTNGAHRGNRRDLAATRDVFLVEYSADASNIWGGDIDTTVFRALPAGAAKPFERMLAVPKRWSLPLSGRPPNWVASLPQIETWL